MDATASRFGALGARLTGGMSRLADFNPFADRAIQTGIKWALAGLLSLFFALVLRLDEPTWAVSTAFVLSVPKFVGAIAEKTVFRIFGALCGAVLGYLITGSLQQSPALFLLAMGSLVAFTTAMYGGKFAPYGVRQAGYTATLVAAQGMAYPDLSWSVGLARCEEICLGIVVTAAVSGLVWPRYAREEFSLKARKHIQVLRGLFAERAKAFLSASAQPPDDVIARTAKSLSGLRTLLRTAAFESPAFRAQHHEINDMVLSLADLAAAIRRLGRTLPEESILLQRVRLPAEHVHENILELMEVLSKKRFQSDRVEHLVAAVQDAIDDYNAAVRQIRADRLGDAVTASESLEHAGYMTALHSVSRALARLAVLLPTVDSVQVESLPAVQLRSVTVPSTGWIRAGIRGGICVVIGLALTNWTNIPGGVILVVGTYLMTAFSLADTDRRGDLGAFRALPGIASVCVIYFLFLLIVSPALASYEVMNIALGALLFWVGYASEKGWLTSFWVIFMLLITVSLVGVNAQIPVAFEVIAGSAFGILFASILSALIRRLLWPVLPQHALRERILGLVQTLRKNLVDGGAHVTPSDRAAFTLASGDAIDLGGIVRKHAVVASEAASLNQFLESLARLGAQRLCEPRTIPDGVPSGIADLVRDFQHRCSEDIDAALDVIDARVSGERKNRKTAAVEPPSSIAEAVKTEATDLRTAIRASNLTSDRTIPLLALLQREVQSAASADSVVDAAIQTDFERVFFDSKL